MPLPLLPECFFYSQSESRLKHSDTAQGDIDFDHLVQNRPDYWINSSLFREKRKKKLIFANCSNIDRSSRFSPKSFFAMIRNIMNENFEIYFWENASIVHVKNTSNTVLRKMYEAVESQEAAFPDDIKKAAFLQYQLSQDELHIVDDYWLKYLHHENEGNKYRVSSANLDYRSSTFDKPNKKSPILISDHLITDIEVTTFTKYLNNTVNLLKKIHPTAQVKIKYETVELAALEAVSFTQAMTKNLNYSLNGLVFTPENLVEVVRFVLNGSALDDMNSLFQTLKKMRSLNRMAICDSSFKGLSDLSSKFEHLAWLGLYNCAISGLSLKNLLTASPHIKHLELVNCNLEGSCEIPDLGSIESLFISANQHDLIRMLVEKSPQLEYLKLEGPCDLSLQSFLHSLEPKVLIEVQWASTKTQPTVSTPFISSLAFVNDIPNSLRKQKDELRLDADTQTDPNKKLPVQRIFYSVNAQSNPPINSYRLAVYQNIAINDDPCSMQEAFTLKKSGDLELQPSNVRCSPVDVYGLAKQYQDKTSQAYYGKQKLVLTREWHPIASLSPEETLLAYHLEPDTAVEFCYSKRDNLYYVRSKTDAVTDVTLDFMVSVPNIKRDLPPSIETLVSQYNTFTNASLTELPPNPMGQDYLKAIQEQKKGACRHRSLAFKAEMKKEKEPVRIVNNDCHSFVEIYSEGTWIRRDLGSASAELVINEDEEPPQQSNDVVDNSSEALYLETWKKESIAEESVTAFCQKILQPKDGTKQLIELTSTNDVHALSYLLQHQGKHSGHAVFYINSPEELVCAAPWINKQPSGKGVLTAGPGGRLYDFLTKNQPNTPRTLVINYANFSPEDVVRLNTLLDKEPQIDGVPIPASVQVVGLTNTQGPNYYSGEDFYSRFDAILTAPKSTALLEAQQERVTAPRLRTGKDTKLTSLHLFHSFNWKNELLGHWIMEGKNIRFKDGLLQKALDTGLPLLIHQGLWDDGEFVAFWKQAKLYGRIEHSGGVLNIPSNLELLKEDVYDWAYLTQNIQDSAVLDEQAPLLNPGTFSQFFSHYICDNLTKTLSRKPGLIETAGKQADKILPIYLTRALSDDQWAMLGHACHEQGVILKVHPAPGVILPAILPIKSISANTPQQAGEHLKIELRSTTVIQSSDVDATVAMLTNNQPEWLVIDVTGCKGHDLLTKIHASFDAKALSFEFSQTQQALLTALEKGQKVVLKGTFSPELLDELAPLLQQRAQEKGIKTTLALIGDDLSQGHYFKGLIKHDVTIAEKLACLGKVFSEAELALLPENLRKTESLARLKARLIHQRIHPGKNSDEAWSGLIGLPQRMPLAELNKDDDTQALAQVFHVQRKKQVMNAFAHAPYVYLSGLTGGGKSTFVAQYLKTDKNINFYSGQAALKKWAMDKTPGKMKLFFEDEINLSLRQWNELEGLFHNPPGILIEGEYFPLTQEHRFIMAGNPMAYGDERRLSPVFERHGNALLFDSLPLACIYEDVLKPMFAGTDLAQNTWAVCQPFLEVYRFLLTHSKTNLLISPRELQMMAALTLAYCQRNPKANAVDVACYYALQVTQHLVPPTEREAYAALPIMNKAKQQTLNQPPFNKEANLSFLLTPSRQPIANQLSDLLALSELRKNKATQFNSAQLYGGLGGLILTGDAGIGKSELVIAVLRQQGYQERHFKPRLSTDKESKEHEVLAHKIFYRMPAGLPLKIKQQLILKAFDEGAVLIADEINSSAMLERWFNDLLMGKHPLTGMPPKHPGFFLIGTQNPVTLAGRRKASPATDRRLMQITAPPYEHEEMVEILVQKGLSQARAKRLVSVYDNKRAYALEHHLKPPPVFRDLLKLTAIEIKKEYQQALNALEQTLSRLPLGSIKESTLLIKDLIVALRANNEQHLTPYLTITNQLLCATPESRVVILAQFRQIIVTGQKNTSPTWQKLGKALCYLGIALAVISIIAIAFTGFGIIPAIGLGVATASLISSMGIFASNQSQGLAKAMKDLDKGLQQEPPEPIPGS